MQACRRTSTIWRTVAAIGMVVFAVSTIRQVSGIALADRESLRGKYHWPAKIPYPKENPYSEAKFKLGRMLFFDPILSGSGNRSCISCHNPGLSWADGQPRAVGLTQELLTLHCPTLLGVAWIPRPGWSGRFRDLESVAMTPITSPLRVKSRHAALKRRCPLYLQKRTFGSTAGMSALCQKQTFRPLLDRRTLPRRL